MNNKLSKEAEKIITDLYEKVMNLQDKFDSVRKEIMDLVNNPDIKDLCKAPETIEKVSVIIEEIQSITTDITEIVEKMTEYYELLATAAMEIIAKAVEVLKLECKSLILFMSEELAKYVKEELTRLLDGEGTAAVVTISAPMAMKLATAQIVSKLMSILDMVISALNLIPLLNIDGGAMVLFPTPKSIMRMVSVVKMQIVNAGNSLGNMLGQLIEPKLTEVAESFNLAIGSEKVVKIAAAAATGATTVMTDAGVIVPPISFKKIDTADIMRLVNTALALLSIGQAEPLPRYEKLNIINLRYMVFLITGFIPAGYQAFGIPNYP